MEAIAKPIEHRCPHCGQTFDWDRQLRDHLAYRKKHMRCKPRPAKRKKRKPRKRIDNWTLEDCEWMT